MGECHLLDTQRLLLRKFSPDDWQDLHAYLSDPTVVAFEPYEPFTPEMSRQEAARRAKDESFIAVCLRDNQQLIGNVYLAEQAYGTFEIGYVFSAAHRHKGYATEAARAVMHHAFTTCSARRIVAMCNPHNEPSWRLLERLHFRREDHLLQNIYFKKDADGQPLWCDTYEYGILATEWTEHSREAQDVHHL